MRKTWLGAVASLAAHVAAVSAIIFAQSWFREDPVTVIDFSLEKAAISEPKKDPPLQPRTERKPRKPPVEKKEAFPDTTKTVPSPPALLDVSEPIGPVAEPAAASGSQHANVIDSTVLKKEYVTAQYGVIRDKVYRALSYPAYAQEEGWQGTVKMSFLVNRDGSVDSILILKSSGYNLLDNNAVKAIRKAAPYPYAPARLQILLPVVYRLE